MRSYHRSPVWRSKNRASRRRIMQHASEQLAVAFPALAKPITGPFGANKIISAMQRRRLPNYCETSMAARASAALPRSAKRPSNSRAAADNHGREADWRATRLQREYARWERNCEAIWHCVETERAVASRKVRLRRPESRDNVRGNIEPRVVCVACRLTTCKRPSCLRPSASRVRAPTICRR
jgi:hypothetical protein